MRPLVAWDVDDVLNDLTREWLSARHPSARFDALAANPPLQALGLSRAECLSSLDAFRRERYPSLAPNARLLRWLGEHGARARHVAVTAAPLFLAPASAAWVMRHFAPWIRGYHIVPSPRPDDPVPTARPDKSAVLDGFLGPVVLVDDSSEHVERARSAGHEGLLFPRPWNGAPGDADTLLAELLAQIDRMTQR